jgi:hypothetical protein
VSSALPIVLFGLGGMLLGGVFSLRKQGFGILPVAVVGVLAAASVAGGVLWLIGEG